MKEVTVTGLGEIQLRKEFLTMQIKGQGYLVTYHPATATITCKGAFRLRRNEYAPIVRLLNGIAALKPPLIILDLRELQFLNSSGVSVLSKFVIIVRKLKATQMVVLGNRQISWQSRSLRNFQKLMRGLKVEWAR